MVFVYNIRDLFLPHKDILQDAGIKEGDAVLDYGCGSGGYITATTDLVGQSGKVYALDINPLAIQHVQRIVARNQLTIVETICADRPSRLSDVSIDIVLWYDWFHETNDHYQILEEIHRVLKSQGILSLSDPLKKEVEIRSIVTRNGLFEFVKRDTKSYRFLKVEQKRQQEAYKVNEKICAK
jgi:ubiquinone/menaquinone biosynthesis C-methylase UbiE